MRIELEDIGKHYGRNWVFRSMNLVLLSGRNYAVSGPNGSGKTTFLQILSGFLSPSAGAITYFRNDREIGRINLYKQLNFAAPYIELIEEYTLTELLIFHQQFKPFAQNHSTGDIIELLDLKNFSDERIEDFSSGMKQRLRLILALCSESDLLLLDEPTTNLDEQGERWMYGLIEEYSTDRTVVIASNNPDDFEHCEEEIDMLNFK